MTEFKNIDFKATQIEKEYDYCHFFNCNFDSANLSNVTFVESVFENCNLSNVVLTETCLNDVKFINCKMIGLNFNDCNTFIFSIDFVGCNLSLSSFYQMNLVGQHFEKCKLQEVDFVETNLSKVNFDGSDLSKAVFERSKLEKADFRTAINYSFDPELNQIKKAKFSRLGVLGLLSKYDITIVS